MTLSREDIFGGDEFLPQLVEELESAFPPCNPSPNDNMPSIMYKAGAREVVNYIKAKLETE